MTKLKLKKIIVALDNMNETQIYDWMNKATPDVNFVKIGLEAYCRYGRSLIETLKETYGLKIFLDLKLHDIPNTVSKTISAFEGLPIDFLTVHLTGGEEMLSAALNAQKKSLPRTKLLGVSYLTSLGGDDFEQIWGVDKDSIPKQFGRLFNLAHQSKIHGLVCSAQEAKALRDFESKNSLSPLQLVCPGIRFSDEIKNSINIGDQKRVLSPQQAFDLDVDYLVIGRSLTQSQDLRHRLDELHNVEKNI
jgi:orotidine-5'-phosphate decarboxylase